MLDPFRSSLSPKIMEALVCAQDWLRALGKKEHVNVEEQLQEIEKLDQGELNFFDDAILTCKILFY